jgi:hydrogenase maturation protease
MTIQQSESPKSGAAVADRSARPATSVGVDVLVCGSPDRGDDGAPIKVAGLIDDRVPEDVRVRIVGQLDIDDLLAVPRDAGVVIVDAAVGISPGRIVEMPVTGLVGRDDGFRARSSHALAFPEVIGLAGLIRSRPVRGSIVAIGGLHFGLGAALSRPVAVALPALADAVVQAVERTRLLDSHVKES